MCKLLRNEPHAGVRGLLGHFIFAYIHPHMDGNGVGRSPMNTMRISGGYHWSVVPVESTYMPALEATSVEGDIAPFAQLLAECVDGQIEPIFRIGLQITCLFDIFAIS